MAPEKGPQKFWPLKLETLWKKNWKPAQNPLENWEGTQWRQPKKCGVGLKGKGNGKRNLVNVKIKGKEGKTTLNWEKGGLMKGLPRTKSKCKLERTQK